MLTRNKYKTLKTRFTAFNSARERHRVKGVRQAAVVIDMNARHGPIDLLGGSFKGLVERGVGLAKQADIHVYLGVPCVRQLAQCSIDPFPGFVSYAMTPVQHPINSRDADTRKICDLTNRWAFPPPRRALGHIGSHRPQAAQVITEFRNSGFPQIFCFLMFFTSKIFIRECFFLTHVPFKLAVREVIARPAMKRHMTLRVGLIGAGVMGSDHARIISEDVPGATVQAVCDASMAAARRVAEQCDALAVETAGFDLIARRDVDAVVIASPDPTHAALTLTALKLRKPVLCEKPLAHTPADCWKVLEAETAIGVQLVQVGFMRRFDPAYAEMQAALQSGKIGSPVMMHNIHRNVETPSDDFTGAMAITNSAVHEFDMIRFMLRTEVAAISAFEPARDLGPCKPVVMVLHMREGEIVTVEVNNTAAYGYDVRSELVGTEGSFSLAGPSCGRLDARLQSATAYPADWRPRFAEAYRLQNKAWVRSVITGETAAGASNTWDGYCACVVAEAGVAALRSGQRVDVKLGPRPALYDGLGAAA